jgi:subtilase family serine protease
LPDVAFQASSRTAPLVYDSFDGGWFLVGGTSCSSPQFAGIVALADQVAGHGLGPINNTLYTLASNPADYAADFYDVTTGNNQGDPDVTGFPATTGWDPVTGLGTPNAANLVPALAAG